MITNRIEKAILSGWATYQKVAHSFSSFGSITIPKDHTVIILDITWNHFWNSYKIGKEGQTTLADLFRLSEYQLKIDGKKSKNFLIFKNKINLQILDSTISIDVNTPIQQLIAEDKLKYILPNHSNPIQKDVFFVCEEYINLTVTRNSYVRNIATDYAPLNPSANQNVEPSGIGGVSVVKNLQADAIGGLKNYLYRPPNKQNSEPNSFGANDQTMFSYSQPYDQTSVFTNVNSNDNFLFYKFPLIEIGYVIFNNNETDKILNQ